MVSLCVFKDGDWLQLGTLEERYDSINTLVMRYATAAYPISVGDHEVLIHLRYPVYTHHGIISKDHLTEYESLS